MITIHPSARKRGSSDDALSAMWSSWIRQAWLEDDLPGRVLRMCIDDAGRPWEMVGIVFDDERVMVIHAMRWRKSTTKLIEEAGA
ncbi:MAG: hypothetical protein FWG47_07530 [Propionibacteriaceae bacterium]|nr:hypothetical protein [Propionibacteriaceae bacterium]